MKYGIRMLVDFERPADTLPTFDDGTFFAPGGQTRGTAYFEFTAESEEGAVAKALEDVREGWDFDLYGSYNVGEIEVLQL